MRNDWLGRARISLFRRSEEKKNFVKARQEWLYDGLEDNQSCDCCCELCDHEGIRYEYMIVNKLNRNTMIVGSECIKKFTEDFKTEFYDTEGNLVNEARLTQDRNEYLKEVLHRALDELLVDTDNTFYRSIVSKIKKDGKLTPNQLKCLRNFYPSLNEIGQQAFKNIVKVSLKRDREKEQIYALKPYELRFVAQFMTSGQRNRFNIHI